MIPEDPDALLSRRATAEALTAAGYQTEPTTLATKASRGGGPRFRKFGQRTLYRWGDALDWARNRLTEPRRSTSEQDADAARVRSVGHAGAPATNHQEPT